MKSRRGYELINPDDLRWRPSNLMRIPNADFLERTGSEKLGARLWRLPPRSANTLHKHVRQEEFFFVLEGTGRMRIGDETLTVPRHGGVWVKPEPLRQVFNDTDEEVLWLIVGGPEELEFLQGTRAKIDLTPFYPVNPAQLPPELAGVEWPPRDGDISSSEAPPPIDHERHAREWLAAWNAHDLERILSHYSEDVEFVSPFVARLAGRDEGAVRGKAALRDYFVRGLASFPSLKFEYIRLHAGVRSCVLEYRSVNGLRAAETMEFDRSGRVCRVLAHYAES